MSWPHLAVDFAAACEPSLLRPPPRPEAEVLARRMTALEDAVGELRNKAAAPTHPDRVALLVFNDDLDRLLATMTLANAAAISGSEVCLFFSFWSVALLRRPDARPSSFVDRLLAWLLPTAGTAKLSRMHLWGLGSWLMRRRMRAANMATLEEHMEMARTAGVHIRVCSTSLTMLGMRETDLIDYPALETCGAAAFLEFAMDSRLTLFV
jgi:peroxiredoxin family protein